MHVVATAGHVDHGKSTLVRALTGTDPDRTAEEKRRGLTIELGHAHTVLPSGATVAFVDVPGHERFGATMVAGVGAVPAALLVVAADEGWSAQTAEHVAVLDALRVAHAVVVVTKTDRADPAPVAADVTTRLAATMLAGAPWVGVSARTGAGFDHLRAALDALVAVLPAAPPTTRVRLVADRVFVVRGAGTVVTGTLAAGTVEVGGRLQVGDATAVVRGLEVCHEVVGRADAVCRVAVNLRGSPAVSRGEVLTTPDAWPQTTVLDALLDRPAPRAATFHLAAASTPATVRPLGPAADGTTAYARITLARPLPLEAGDRCLLRDPGGAGGVVGLTVVDVAPPPLDRRGAAARRAAALGVRPHAGTGPAAAPADVADGPETVPGLDLTPLADLERCWAAGEFAAPDGADLQRLGLDRRTLARLGAGGHLLRLAGDVVLPPGADERALTVLRALPQPFTVADAKAALGVSRRVAVPLLEHLDAHRRTRRDGDTRHVR